MKKPFIRRIGRWSEIDDRNGPKKLDRSINKRPNLYRRLFSAIGIGAAMTGYHSRISALWYSK